MTNSTQFKVTTHAARSTLAAGASPRNTTIEKRGVTFVFGMMPDGTVKACSTTQVDFIMGGKEAKAVKVWGKQPTHSWLLTAKKLVWVYVGVDATTGPQWTPDEAAQARIDLQASINEGITYTGVARAPSVVTACPDLKSAKAKLRAALKEVHKVKEVKAEEPKVEEPAAENAQA